MIIIINFNYYLVPTNSNKSNNYFYFSESTPLKRVRNSKSVPVSPDLGKLIYGF